MQATLAILGFFLGAGNTAADPAVLQREFIFEQPPHRSCHASTIAQTRSGTLVAAWFGGSYEKHPDVGVWMSRRVDGRWTTPVEVFNGVQYVDGAGKAHRHPCWNPVLFQPREGPLLLFWKVGPSPSTWWGMMATSSDDGRTWSAPRRLPEGILATVKNQPLQLADGTLLCPSSTEHSGWQVHFERTGDLGLTWTRVGPINDGKEIGIIQPCLLKHPGGKLQALCRTRGQGRIAQTWSDDGGLSWSKPALTPLPNPNSGIDAITLQDGSHLLVYNHTAKGRSPLNLAVSRDGKQWQAALVLEQESGAEFSYPQVIQTQDGRVHVCYTWKRQRIRHLELDPARLRPRDFVGGAWPE